MRAGVETRLVAVGGGIAEDARELINALAAEPLFTVAEVNWLQTGSQGSYHPDRIGDEVGRRQVSIEDAATRVPQGRDATIEIVAPCASEAGQIAEILRAARLQQKAELVEPLGRCEKVSVILQGAYVLIDLQALDKLGSGGARDSTGANLTDLKQSPLRGDPRIGIATETHTGGRPLSTAVDKGSHHDVDRHIGGEHEEVRLDAKSPVMGDEIRGDAG